jgi:cysteinyl-tRNA synthetase
MGMIKLYNTLNRQVEGFQPLEQNKVRLYTCGPTVYHFAHIGNLRSYIFADLLRRVLEYNDLQVIQGMNITDVGHLVGDADEGEDKIDVAARREGKHPLEIAKFYEEVFFNDLAKLNILPAPNILKATETITEQIEIIKQLEAKEFTYRDELAIYFDTSKLSDYGKLSGQKLSDKLVGARDEVVVDSNKKRPQDFALWFFLTGRYKDHILHWPSPWGEGFPGWHIECSAISRKLLGQPFDIHTGGVDHIGTHHTNEIAQSEAAFNLPLANYWMHGEFLLVENKRMGKSEGNLLTLTALEEQGFSPLDYRYLCLTAHYRTQLNFTAESLKSAQIALGKLYDFVREIDDSGQKNVAYKEKFTEAINNDLNIPKALAVAWEMISDNQLSNEDKKTTLLDFDRVLGLNLHTPPELTVTDEVRALIEEREQARQNKDFAKSDELRDKIKELGFEIEDKPEGYKVKKLS